MFDGKAFGAEMTEIVKGYVDRATAPLVERIATLEKRQPERGEKGEIGQSGERGETGIGVAGALIDRSGVLILTLSDGTTRDLGPVVGKDGRDGADGKDGEAGKDGADGKDGEKGLDGAAGKDGQDGIDGKDGEPGKDGADGLGFDDLQITHDGERGFTFRLEKGDRIKEFPFSLPVVLDRGVFKEGDVYQAGDGVTWAGSFWIAQQETKGKPGEGADWRLSVKRGRDGKDAK